MSPPKTMFPRVALFLVSFLWGISFVFQLLEPIVGGAAAWTIGAEIATPSMMLGGALIVFALMLSEFYGARKASTRIL